MYVGSIFLLLGILLLVILYIARPLLLHRSTLVTKEEHDLSALLAEKERLISAIQELDFDHVLGKIPAEDYPTQRSALLAETAEILQRIDALREQQLVANAPAHPPRQATEPRRAAPIEGSPDDELEALIANRRRERAEKAAGFCPQCGKPVQQSDRFCSRCGTPLLEEVEQAE